MIPRRLSLPRIGRAFSAGDVQSPYLNVAGLALVVVCFSAPSSARIRVAIRPWRTFVLEARIPRRAGRGLTVFIASIFSRVCACLWVRI